MISSKPARLAFETAKEIVVATMANNQYIISGESGELVGNYFDAIYNMLLEITKANEE